MTTAPNAVLRSIRMSLLMSQDEFARALQAVGQRVGHPNDASKRLVQRWESGAITTPRPVYARALQALTGLPIAALGFSLAVPPPAGSAGEGGHDVELSPMGIPPAAGDPVGKPLPGAHYNGIWLSRYEYFSSGRDGKSIGQHFVLVLQQMDRLTLRSLPESAKGSLSMDLTIDGNVLTGTWVEQTDPTGYYKAGRYHGAIQLLAEPTGRRMVGKWVGFGKEMDINTGPWELVFQTASTNKATLAEYNRRPLSAADTEPVP